MKKILKNISFIATIVILILSVSLVILSTIAKKENKLFPVFGYSYSVVATSSMEPEIGVGEIIIIKKLDYDKYLETAQVGEDVLVYWSNHSRIYIVHQLHEITDDGLILKGTNNPTPDTELVNGDNFQGIVVSHGLAWFGKFLFGNRPIIFLVIVLFLIFIILTEVFPYLIKKENKEKEKLNEEARRLLEEQIRKEIEEEKNA
ncbi:MAG: signal peptidase I [Acholeplasmataceae bacterium]|jgi:signal peptidase